MQGSPLFWNNLKISRMLQMEMNCSKAVGILHIQQQY